jgi:hypothetical protein
MWQAWDDNLTSWLPAHLLARSHVSQSFQLLLGISLPATAVVLLLVLVKVKVKFSRYRPL